MAHILQFGRKRRISVTRGYQTGVPFGDERRFPCGGCAHRVRQTGSQISMSEALKDMPRERRTGQPAVPADLHRKMNDSQKATMRQLENFGWSIAFVRRPLFLDPIIVVRSFDNGRFGVVSSDGKVEFNPELPIRN